MQSSLAMRVLTGWGATVYPEKKGLVMRSIWRATAIGALVLSVWGCAGPGDRRDSAKVEKLKELIDSEIPAGSTEKQVVVFLDRHRFSYSNEIASQSAIFAVAPFSSNNDLVRVKLQVAFHFDKSRRLRGYAVTRSLVGP